MHLPSFRTCLAALALTTTGWAQEFVAVETDQFSDGPEALDVDGNVLALASPNGVSIRFQNTFGDWIPEVSFNGTNVVSSFLSLSLEGNWLAVGDVQSDVAATNAGKVQLWERLSPGWWVLGDALTASDAAAGDSFGVALDTEEGVMVIGASDKFTGPTRTGAAYVFELGPLGWQEVARLAPPVVPTEMGQYVATDGERILVSARDLVFVYERQGGTWRHTDTLEPDTQTNRRVTSLDLKGERALCGVRAFSESRGAVMLFENDGAGWQRTAVLENPEGQIGDRMGSSVAFQEGLIATGSTGDDYPPALNGGSVQLFANLGGTWQLVETIAPTGNSVDVRFGNQLVLVDSELFVTTESGRSPRVYEVLPAHPDTYCQSTENSSGLKTSLWTQGSTSVSANDLVLSAGPAANVVLPASFFYGPGQAEIPFSAGIICVGGPMHRLPVVTLPDGLVYNLAVDLSSPPASPGSQILPGSTWNFQAWYRDFEQGTPVINFSSAATLTFVP